MFSLPDTRLKALISSLVTFCSARALIRCTVAMSRSTSESVTSRPTSNADNSVTVASCGRRRRWDGDSTAARARQEASTFGATSANSGTGSQPGRQLLRVLHRAHPKPHVPAYLGAVVLDRGSQALPSRDHDGVHAVPVHQDVAACVTSLPGSWGRVARGRSPTIFDLLRFALLGLLERECWGSRG
ncbi:hypothetical protein [Frankia sp. Cr1]|uniref:hypothetical protein n=1 Tax=Frankia sp. Cr1 TaxID=3073931 RepID=UPI002AD505BD|nr:hypothetical protein [Frankia sp. Cr1]